MEVGKKKKRSDIGNCRSLTSESSDFSPARPTEDVPISNTIESRTERGSKNVPGDRE